MSKSMRSIEMPELGRVFPVTGMITAGGVQLVGLFRSARAARSVDADNLAIGTLDRAKVAPDVADLADRNAEAI